MYPFVFLFIAIICTTIQVLMWHTAIPQTLLLWTLVACVGLQGLYAFMGHFFFADDTAKKIGWPAGNPFQKEVAFTNLTFGVTGILCFWLQGYFWLAVIISRTIFTWGAAYLHIVDIIKRKNLNIFNAGPVLWMAILIPVFLIGLFVWGN